MYVHLTNHMWPHIIYYYNYNYYNNNNIILTLFSTYTSYVHIHVVHDMYMYMLINYKIL